MNKPSILYDSLCRLCNTEIDYYRRNDPEKIFEYVDIMRSEFDAGTYKLTKSDVHKYFHVIDEKGNVLKGVEAFNFIWIKLDKFIILQKMYSSRFGRGLMELGYKGFIVIRPLLPRKESCDDYCER